MNSKRILFFVSLALFFNIVSCSLLRTMLYDDVQTVAAPLPSGSASLYADVKTAHWEHYNQKIECERCHSSKEPDWKVQPEVKKKCLDCHEEVAAEKGKPLGCDYCHLAIRENNAPPTHRPDYLQTHGQDVNMYWADANFRRSCHYCHAQSACNECHKTTVPKSHNNFWRRKGHGVMVGLDNNACQTCHLTSFCVRCHESTRPRSHSGSWGPSLNRHCYGCHVNVSVELCNLCHKRIEHETAPTRPNQPYHQPGALCLSCHAVSLKHPDNGDSCEYCHRLR